MILVIGLGVLFTLGQPSPSTADANVVCDVGGGVGGVVNGGVEAVTGGIIGGGNPAQDVCDSVTGAVGGVVKNPIGDALKGIGNGIFEQITQWVSDGAAWLIGEVVKGIQQSTTPQLTAKGFLNQYAKMAAIAALMGMAMLLLAVLEGVAQGNAGMLIRVVLVNLPLAFIATSVAYIVVQLLLVATDGMCDAISSATGHHSQKFFQSAVKSLSDAGGAVGGAGGGPATEAGGKVGVPLFVTFLAAIIGAFAALMVWLELIMRDAAVYVCSMFLPFSLAASIWPRWMGALRRSVELLLVVISSKFVIVAILAMSAALLAEPGDGVEPILAASALLLISCFAPFVLMKFVPFAEGAMTAAYSRRSASGGAIGSVQLASDVAILRGMMRSNSGGDSGVSLWDAAETGGGGGGKAGGGRSGPDVPRGGVPTGGVGGSGGAAGSGAGAGAGGGAAAGGAAGGAASAAAAAPVAAQRGAQTAGKKLSRAGSGGDEQSSRSATASSGEGKPRVGQGASEGQGEKDASKPAGEKPPRPSADRPGPKPEESR